jgi:uncharacterized OB-fold protein
MGEFSRPMPVPTPTTQPFWDALAQHTIRIQYSPSAQRYVFYPRVLAPGTLADDLEWREISGAALLHTYTVAHRPVAPHFANDVPQILAVAQWAPVRDRDRQHRPLPVAGRYADTAGIRRRPRTRDHIASL